MTVFEQKIELIGKLLKMANEYIKDWTFDKYCEIQGTISDWNRDHEDDEIFMCDISNREDEVCNGFMIEDICFYFEDNEIEEEYTRSSTAGDYSPSNPWDAPGMSISDFI